MTAPDKYRERRKVALTRCRLIHNLGPEHVAGCCLCQRWADVFRDEPEPQPAAERDAIPLCDYCGQPRTDTTMCHRRPEPAPVELVECCASGRCEVCTPGYDWGRDG